MRDTTDNRALAADVAAVCAGHWMIAGAVPDRVEGHSRRVGGKACRVRGRQ